MTLSVRDTLKELEATLADRVGGLRDELMPLERELAEARRLLAVLDRESEPVIQAKGFESTRAAANYFARLRTRPAQTPLASELFGREVRENPYSTMTMKQLIVKALRERFFDGARANDLLEYFADAWDRNDIVRESLSPQLSRLKADGVLELDGLVWRLAKDALENSEMQGPPPLEKIEPPKGNPTDGPIGSDGNPIRPSTPRHPALD